MLEIDYDHSNGGWQRPLIKPNEPFEIDPANATLHYAIECFEGAKAYRTVDDKVIMFRILRNFMRMNNSHRQLGIPNLCKVVPLSGLACAISSVLLVNRRAWRLREAEIAAAAWRIACRSECRAFLFQPGSVIV